MHREIKRVYMLSANSILTLGFLAAGVFFYRKKKQETEAVQAERDAHIEAERQEFLNEISRLQDVINPNGSDGAPLTFTCTARFGGLTLNQLEVWLNIKNNSDLPIEIGDIRSTIVVGGYLSERVFPANISRFIVPANSTSRIRLYARGDVAFPNNYKLVKRALCTLAGLTKIKDDTNIPASKMPVMMDIDYLWFVKGNSEEQHVYDVPGDFDYKFAGWTVGSYQGYNAGRENQQKANPSYWEKYDEHEEE